MADDKINWQIEIDGKGALDTLDKVKASAKEIDLSKKALGDVNMRAAMSDLLATHRIAKDVADASKMETRARQDNLRLSRQQREEEAKRAQEAAKKALADRQSAIAGLRNIGIGGVVGTLAMTRNMASSGFSDTLQGQQADVYGQLLNRQVAAIFAPLLEEKTKYVSQMTAWLSGLREPQRESIRQMTMLAGSLTTFGFVVPKVTNGLMALAGGSGIGRFASMGSGVGGAVAAGGAAGPWGAVAAGFVSLLASTKEGRESLADLAKSFEPVVTSLASVAKDLARVAAAIPKGQAATETMNVIDQNTNGAFSRIAEWLRPVAAWLTGVSPEVAARTNLTNIFARPTPPATGGMGLSPIPKGFEEIEAAFNRINESATKMDLNQQLQTANGWLEQIANNTGQPPIVQGVNNAIVSALVF